MRGEGRGRSISKLLIFFAIRIQINIVRQQRSPRSPVKTTLLLLFRVATNFSFRVLLCISKVSQASITTGGNGERWVTRERGIWRNGNFMVKLSSNVSWNLRDFPAWILRFRPKRFLLKETKLININLNNRGTKFRSAVTRSDDFLSADKFIQIKLTPFTWSSSSFLFFLFLQHPKCRG